MSKRIKTILWSVVALAVLVAAALVLVLTAPEETVSQLEIESITLIDEKYSDTESIHIVNPYDDYTIELVGAELWRVRDTMELEQKASMFDETVTDLANFTVTETVEEDCADLDRFGLKEPTMYFESKYSNGNTYRINIGVLNGNRSHYYICVDGENTVYLTPTTAVAKVLLTRYSYLETQIMESFDQNDVSEFPEVTRVKIWNASNNVTLLLDEAKDGELGENAVQQQSHLVLREPCFSLISIDKAETPIYGTFGLIAKDIVKANITAEDRTYYGFDKPTARFEIDYNDKEIVFEIGAGFNFANGYTEGEMVQPSQIDSYFLISKGIDQIYVVNAADLPWLDLDTRDMVSPTILLPNIMDLDGFAITVDGKAHNVVFDKGGDPANTAAYTATLDGKDADMDKIRTFMQLILMTSVQDVTGEQPVGDPEIEIVYDYSNGDTNTIKVYVAEDTTTYVTLNEKTVYVGRYGYVGKVTAELKDLLEGGEVDTKW